MKKNYLSRLLHYKSIIAITAAVAMVATPIVSYSAVGSSAEKVIAKEAKEEENATPSDAENSTDNAEVDVDGDVVNDIESKDKADEANTDTASKNEELDASKTADTETETEKKQAVEDAIKKLKEYEAGLESGTLTESELIDIEEILSTIADFDFTELGILEEDNAFLESFAKALDEYEPAVVDAIVLDPVYIDINEGSDGKKYIKLPGEYSDYTFKECFSNDIDSVSAYVCDYDRVSIQGLAKGSATVTIKATNNDDSDKTASFTCYVTVSNKIYLGSRDLPAGDSIVLHEFDLDDSYISAAYQIGEGGLIKLAVDDDKESVTVTSTGKSKTGITRVIIALENDTIYSIDINVVEFEYLETMKLGYYTEKILEPSYLPDKNLTFDHYERHSKDSKVKVDWYGNDSNSGKFYAKSKKFGDDVFYIYAQDSSEKMFYYVQPVTVYCDYYSSDNTAQLDEGDTLVLPDEFKIDNSDKTFKLSELTHLQEDGDDDDIDEGTNDNVGIKVQEEDGKYVLSAEGGSGNTTYSIYFGDGYKTYCVKYNLEVAASTNVVPWIVWYDAADEYYWWDYKESTDSKAKFKTKTFTTKAGADIRLYTFFDEDSDNKDAGAKLTVKYVFSNGTEIEDSVTIEENGTPSSVTPPDTTKGYTCVIDTTKSASGAPMLIVTCTEQSGGDDSDKDKDDDNSNNHSSSGSSSGGSSTGWVKDSKGWRYRNSDGILAQGTTVTDADGNKVEKILWQKAGNGYYAFGSDGYLLTGWIYDRLDNKWYYCDESSGKKYGWLYEAQDGYWYYLLPSTGEALTGWQNINGKDYYFAGAPSASTYSFDASTGCWIYSNLQGIRPFGSMYAAATTPDNSVVDADGAKIR